jgi:undecaprenyl-diphosphatase
MRSAALKAVDDATSLLISLPQAPWIEAVDKAVAIGNGVPLWATSSCALAVTGSRGRRAALEGLVAAAVASTISNQVIKRVTPRRRPIPVPRRLPKKSTPSLPSSHTATAFAYASAVAGRWPVAGLPAAATAVAIAATRVHGRQHHLADVVTGAALGLLVGASVAVASRKAFDTTTP